MFSWLREKFDQFHTRCIHYGWQFTWCTANHFLADARRCHWSIWTKVIGRTSSLSRINSLLCVSNSFAQTTKNKIVCHSLHFTMIYASYYAHPNSNEVSRRDPSQIENRIQNGFLNKIVSFSNLEFSDNDTFYCYETKQTTAGESHCSDECLVHRTRR